MGNERYFIKTGGFSAYLYETVGQSFTCNGVTAKVVKLKTDKDGLHAGLPQCSNTSDMYLRLGPDGLPCQARLFVDRRSFLDFDWGHNHTNSSGEHFEHGIVHVQSFIVNKNGERKRQSDHARLMTEEEIRLYGPILIHFNPNIRFRS